MHKVLQLLQTLDANFYSESVGVTTDEWQGEVITSESKNIIMLASRQSGKTTTVALKASKHVSQTPDRLSIILTPSQRQSYEVMSKADAFMKKSGQVYKLDNALEKKLANNSRIIALPANEKTIRVYSGVTQLILDEASRIPDEVYRATRPMLATSNGELILLSTPFGKRGFFYEAWEDRENWDWWQVTADECPRITPEFLAKEKRDLPEWFYYQEYFCEFVDPVGAVLAHQDILNAFKDNLSCVLEDKDIDVSSMFSNVEAMSFV